MVNVKNGGGDNVSDIHKWFEANGQLNVEFRGNRSSVVVNGPQRQVAGLAIVVGDDTSVIIGENCSIDGLYIWANKGAKVTVGASCAFGSRVRFMLHEPADITVGVDCMFGSDVLMLTSDMHTVYNIETRTRINHTKGIFLGNHVWIGLDSVVVKGAQIGSGSVVGLRSLVTGAIPGNCVAVGSPARVVRQGVSWDHSLWPL